MSPLFACFLLASFSGLAHALAISPLALGLPEQHWLHTAGLVAYLLHLAILCVFPARISAWLRRARTVRYH